jgi:hypothetical protein
VRSPRPTELLACCYLLAASPLGAQDWLVLEGIGDGEFWATDSGSILLTRDNGHPALLGRLQLLAGAQLRPTLHLLALGRLEGGRGTDDGDTEARLDQFVLRYLPSRLFIVQAGKFVSPVGTFGPRRFSTTNPLIGVPDGYPVGYPWGVLVSGASDHLDYRIGAVILPVSHERYLPEPSAALRPALGAGFTPTTGVRIGASYTVGPYLGTGVTPALPPGADWKDFDQEIVALDARFSRGYFEFFGELALSEYEVPGHPAQHGINYYGEIKYTWTPRLFTALRLERNKYGFVLPRVGAPWIARTVNFYNGEVGVGYRLTATTIAKASVRADRWPSDLQSFLPNGYAVAVQLSQSFDVMSWLSPRR